MRASVAHVWRTFLITPIAIGLAALGVGCATSSNVAFDRKADFSGYARWDWLPSPVPPVSSPHHQSRALATRMTEGIEREMEGHGFERSRDGADFYVGYHLGLQRLAKMVNVPLAPYLLSSMNSSASYWIEGTKAEKRVFEHMQLAIHIADARGRVVWQGSVTRRLEKGSSIPLDGAISEILDEFPPETSRSGPRRRRHR